MGPQVRDWLPLGALDHPALRDEVGRVVEAWSRAWCARRRLELLSWSPQAQDRRDDADGAGWRAWSGGLALSLSRRARSRLLGLALDVRLEEAGLSDADRHMLDGFARRMTGDLMERLQTAWGAARMADEAERVEEALPSGGVVASVGEPAGGGLLSLALPSELLVPAVRRALPPGRAAKPRPQSRRTALAGLPVRLSARLGKVELSLGEARTLAAGDVLVLDRPIAAGAELVVADGGAPVGRAALSEVAGATTLTFQSHESRDHR